MNRLVRRTWPTVFSVLLAVSGCGGPPPATDATDPLPKLFDNKEVDPTSYGPGSGRGGHGGRGIGGGGGMGVGGASSRHGKGKQDGTGGGARDGTGGGGMKAKKKTDADKTPDTDSPTKESDSSKDSDKPAASDTKKNVGTVEPNKSETDSKDVKNEPTRKEQP